MTLVRTLQTLPNADGTRRPAKGFFIWTPTVRRIIEGNPDEVIQPVGFAVELDLTGAFEIDVAETGTDWVWRVDERIEGLRTKTAYVVVPPEGPVDFTDLAPVNIASLRSTAVPDHIWYVYTDYLAAQATLAKEAAEASELAAGVSQGGAAASAAIAITKATEAGVSATNSATSASSALSHKNAASNSEGLATASALAASNSASASSISATASQTARTGAEAARFQVEAVRDDAESIELNQVHTGAINANGDLILTKRDGTTINAGRVVSGLTVGQVVTGP